jgi:hypothetical protein
MLFVKWFGHTTTPVETLERARFCHAKHQPTFSKFRILITFWWLQNVNIISTNVTIILAFCLTQKGVWQLLFKKMMLSSVNAVPGLKIPSDVATVYYGAHGAFDRSRQLAQAFWCSWTSCYCFAYSLIDHDTRVAPSTPSVSFIRIWLGLSAICSFGLALYKPTAHLFFCYHRVLRVRRHRIRYVFHLSCMSRYEHLVARVRGIEGSYHQHKHLEEVQVSLFRSNLPAGVDILWIVQIVRFRWSVVHTS